MASSSTDPVMNSKPSGAGHGGKWSESSMCSDQLIVYRGMKKAKKERGSTAKERISKIPPCTSGKRSSIYRGVTRHRWTGRYEAHLWDKSMFLVLHGIVVRENDFQFTWSEPISIGAYDDEEAAARAYDLAALMYWGPATLINFPVTDYARDLEEMKNVSREEYLAFLRRKSSGFSRGIAKCRGLSSARWDHMSGPEYLSNFNHGRGDDTTTESDVLGNFCIEREIDLTSYIKWWSPNKTRPANSTVKLSKEIRHGSEEMGDELKTSDWAAQTTELYQIPRLGLFNQVKMHKEGPTVSALSILSRSAAYLSLEEKASKDKEKSNENEKKNVIIKGRGKEVEKETSHNSGSERDVIPLGTSAGSQFQRNMYPSTQFLSAPLLTNCYTIDPMADPVLLSRSSAYKSFDEKAFKDKENSNENDENENKHVIIKDSRKAAEKETTHCNGSERGRIPLGTSAGFQFQRNMHPSIPFLSAPFFTNYNTIDPMVDPDLWSSLVHVLPSGPSHSF